MNDFVAWAKRNNWQVELSNEVRELPEWAFRRYSGLPANYVNFIQHINVLSNKADTTWFLSIDNFKGAAFDTAWQADSFEKISLEAAEGDKNWQNTIIQFWDTHMPIIFCLANGYEYYAIRLNDGAIVHGIEPEFEEVSSVAASFEDFLAKIVTGVHTL